MKLKLTLIVLMIATSIYSQNVINFNEKSYPSTDVFYFVQNASTHNYSSFVKYKESVYLSVGRNNKGGILLLQKNNLLKPTNDNDFNKEFKIEAHLTGDLYLYLGDGSIIHCVDRKIYGYVDDTSSVLYYLTSNEIAKLMKSTIVKVIYSLEAGIREVKKYSASAEDKDTAGPISTLFND
jgi:hypothetical protein